MRSLSAFIVLGVVLAVAPSAHAAPVFPTSYDMPNGETGSWQYWDEIYAPSGGGASAPTTDLAPLFGGLGDLTDGIVASGNWNVVEPPVGNGPYVGWSTVDPIITFHFAAGTTVDSLTIFVDDSNGAGGVSTPGSVRINGGAPILLADGATGVPLSFNFSGLNATGPLSLQLFDGTAPWFFLSEVTFDGRGPSIPEPATLALIGAAFGGLAIRRRRASRATR